MYTKSYFIIRFVHEKEKHNIYEYTKQEYVALMTFVLQRQCVYKKGNEVQKKIRK